MANSILTNGGALAALTVLKGVDRDLLTTQNRIATGLKVNNAKDNSSFWAISTVMRSDADSFKSVRDNLSLSLNSLSVARDGSQQISKLMTEIKQKLTAAQEGSIDKSKLQADITGRIELIDNIVKTASVGGVNLLQKADVIRIVSSISRNGTLVDPNYTTFNSLNLSTGVGGALSGIASLSVLSRGDTILANATDGAKATAFGPIAAITAGLTSVSYTDETGAAKVFSLATTSVAQATLITELNANTEFAKLFRVTAGATANTYSIQAANRELAAKMNITGFQNNGNAGALEITRNQLAFRDVPLKIGDTFTLDFNVSTARKIILQVTDSAGVTAAGQLLGTDASGNSIIALRSSIVSDPVVTGTTIAAEVSAALDTGAFGTEFAVGAAVANTSIGLTLAANVLTLTTASATDTVGNFLPPLTDYAKLLDDVEVALTAAINAAASFGSSQSKLEIQQEFLNSLIDNLTVSIGTLVDADLAEESSKLQALQVQQQLGTQALSIANQAPQTLLSLFR